MNKKAQFSIYPSEKKKKKRVRPSQSEKNEIFKKQHGKCAKCPKRVSPYAQYHHIDGNPSNWNLSNLQLVCLECHANETNKQRIKKIHKKRREQERNEQYPFGASFVSAPKKKKSDNLFGEPSLFGKPTKIKSKDVTGISGFFSEPKKKKGKKKSTDIFGTGF